MSILLFFLLNFEWKKNRCKYQAIEQQNEMDDAKRLNDEIIISKERKGKEKNRKRTIRMLQS